MLRREGEGEGKRMSHLYCSNVMHGNILNEIRVFPPATFPCTLLRPWHLASSTCSTLCSYYSSKATGMTIQTTVKLCLFLTNKVSLAFYEDLREVL